MDRIIYSWFLNSMGLNCVKVKVKSSRSVYPTLMFMGFSRQEYWSRLPFPPSADLADGGVKPASLTSHWLAGGFFTTSTTKEAPYRTHKICIFSICWKLYFTKIARLLHLPAWLQWWLHKFPLLLDNGP